MGRWWQGGDEELASGYLVSRPKAQWRGDKQGASLPKTGLNLACLIFFLLYLYIYIVIYYYSTHKVKSTTGG